MLQERRAVLGVQGGSRILMENRAGAVQNDQTSIVATDIQANG